MTLFISSVPAAHGSNNELRISLRSVEKNLTGVGKIFVIGENPGFLSEKVIHIYHPDEIGPENADGNIALKIMPLAQEKHSPDDLFCRVGDKNVGMIR